MKHNILALPVFLVALAITVGCGRGNLPDGVMERGQMVGFLADAYLLEGYYAVETNYNFDSIPPEMVRAYDDIMERHGVTREQVEASFEYYSNHPALYSGINREVELLIDAKAADQSSNKPAAIEVMPME